MSWGAHVYRELYRLRSQALGPDHPRTRSTFGKYVAAKGGTLSMFAGVPAWKAWAREGRPGFDNRRWRRWLRDETLAAIAAGA